MALQEKKSIRYEKTKQRGKQQGKLSVVLLSVSNMTVKILTPAEMNPYRVLRPQNSKFPNVISF